MFKQFSRGEFVLALHREAPGLEAHPVQLRKALEDPAQRILVARELLVVGEAEDFSEPRPVGRLLMPLLAIEGDDEVLLLRILEGGPENRPEDLLLEILKKVVPDRPSASSLERGTQRTTEKWLLIFWRYCVLMNAVSASTLEGST